MQTDLFTMSKLFTERLLRIPDYQRGYAWSEKQLKDFWCDLEQLEKEKSHYLGVLTLEDVPSDILSTWEDDQWIINAKGFSPFYIVDGQQRLTTTIILIQAITESLKEDEKINYTTIQEIKKKFLWDTKDDGISRSYIFGYEKDNPSYEFLKTNIFLEQSDCSFPAQKTIYTHNLERAKQFFLEKLNDMNISQIEELYRKITQQFLFNIYAISRDIDVCVAFETMNNRGKPLSHLELLKNRLIYLSTKFEVDIYEKKKLRTTVNESWKSIYHYLGKNKDNTLDDDFFLNNHFVIYFSKYLTEIEEIEDRNFIYNRRHGRDFKDFLLEQHFTTKNITPSADRTQCLTVQDVYDYAKSLKISVEDWYNILNPDDSEFSNEIKVWLDKLNRLGILFVAPLIMIFFQKTKDNKLRLDLLKILEIMLFYNELARYKYYMDFDPYSFLKYSMRLSVGKISPEKLIKDLHINVDEYRSNKDNLKRINDNFRNNGFYSWRGVKYFLYEYNLSLMEKSKTHRDKIEWKSYIEDSRDYHTVEHVYPQRPRKPCWTILYDKYSANERNKLRHSLGNLVPLSRAKNSSFQNNCFRDKIGNKDNKVGFRYGSYAEIEIANNSDWTPVDILQRGIKLLEFMEKRWLYIIGDRNKKIHILGLEFVETKDGRSSK